MPGEQSTEIVRSETKVEGQKIDSIYANFYHGKYLVNRRYQRKLVWSLDQKEKLIDSIVNNIPIPLILVARAEKAQEKYEIIDGLQRINAIASFIENEYSYQGKYFNLEAWGLTKLLKDNNTLIQRKPVLSQAESVLISGYTIPVSIYESNSSNQVDETFRRINSSGRKLGMQEIRQAGSTSVIADLVRKISAEIRGDVSSSDVISVREMQSNSLKWRNEESPKGVLVDEVYWVREGILRRDDLRSSVDEQLILDLLLDIFLDQMETTSTVNRDAAYETDTEFSGRLQAAINSFAGLDDLSVQFKAILTVMDQLSKDVLEQSLSWTAHTGKKPNNPSGRYFHIAFLAFYRLIYRDNKKINDLRYVAESTKDYWANQSLSLGGNWTTTDKKKAINKFVGAIQDGFIPDGSAQVRAANEDIERLKSDFVRFASENRFFEIKSGFLDLSKKELDDHVPIQGRRKFFEKILKTATAMANTKPNSDGVIYIGIVDKASTVERIRSLFEIEPLALGEDANPIPHKIVGISHELGYLQVDLDQLIETLKNWTLNSDSISDVEWKKNLASSIRSVVIRDSQGSGRVLVAIHPKSGSQPIAFNNSYYERIGSSNHVAKDEVIVDVFERLDAFRFRNS